MALTAGTAAHPRDRVFRRAWRSQPPRAVAGRGVHIYDDAGREYVDAVSGVYVSNIGHGVERIGAAMAAQANAIAFPYAATFTTEAEQALAAEVIRLAPPGMSKVFFVSGGSEANEVAIKIARKYQQVRGRPSRWRIAGRRNSYHGATMATLSVGGHPDRKRDFIPYLLDFPQLDPPYCYRCPLDLSYPSCGTACATELRTLLENDDAETVAGFIAEPVVGAALGGVVPPPGYHESIRATCDEYDILFIADEVITGAGRTGWNFAIDSFGVVPDLITCGKGLAGGYAPLGAVIIHDRVVDALERSAESSVFTGYTYSGNPVSCTAGVEVLRCVREWDLVARAREQGAWFGAALRDLARAHVPIGDVRGQGLFWGLELVLDRATKTSCAASSAVSERVVQACWERGLIVRSEAWSAGGARREHLILAPPLIATRDELEGIVSVLGAALTAVESSGCLATAGH